MASIWRDRSYQFSADDGTPLNAGTIQFYTTGTSTPKNAFTDEALSVNTPNPITLSAAGRPVNAIGTPIDIWISGRYRIVVKDSSGSIVPGGDIDPVEDSVPSSDFQESTQTYGGNNSGTANAIVFTFVPALTAYTNGQALRGRITADNTGAVTVNCGPGNKSLVKRDGAALVAGDLQGPDIIEFAYDSATDALRLVSGSHVTQFGRLTAVRTYTANDTWTKPTAGLDFIIVEGVGPGGGGGGADVDAGPGSGAGGGGGAGGYARKKIAAASLGSTEAVTIGAFGAGGTAGNNAGSNGSAATSFGAHITCNAGTGGSSVAAGNTVVQIGGGAGGTATGGDINITGQAGHPGVRNGNTYQFGGAGGNSPMGFGMGGPQVFTATAIAGKAATGYGAGGGGAAADDSGTDQAGGAGTSGLVIVYEYSI